MNCGNRHILGTWAGLVIALLTLRPSAGCADTVASLLGNFTINQFCGLKLASDSLGVHYVVVLGQLPALRELHLADADVFLGLTVTFTHTLAVFALGFATLYASRFIVRNVYSPF